MRIAHKSAAPPERGNLPIPRTVFRETKGDGGISRAGERQREYEDRRGRRVSGLSRECVLWRASLAMTDRWVRVAC